MKTWTWARAWMPAMIALAAATAFGAEEGQLLEGGHYLLPNSTISPDGRLGVTVPVLQFEDKIKDPKNRLVAVKTGKVIADLDCKWEAWNRSNHGSYAAKWSEDGALLRWTVGGKWFNDSMVIVKLKDHSVVWQKDLAPECQKTILKLIKAKVPEAYVREKKWNEGSGAAYPEGFSVDVRTEDDAAAPKKLPLKVYVDMTSDPKGIHTEAKDGLAIDAWLNAVLDENGKLTFGDLHLERRPGLKNGWAG